MTNKNQIRKYIISKSCFVIPCDRLFVFLVSIGHGSTPVRVLAVAAEL